MCDSYDYEIRRKTPINNLTILKFELRSTATIQIPLSLLFVILITQGMVN